jgi:hypothetical protein
VDDVPAIARLRRFLKMALRSYALRCESAWMEDEEGRPIGLPEEKDADQQG